MFHFRIQRSSIGAYFVSDKISFATLGELISYYQKNNRSLGVLLEEPCAQQVGCHYTRKPNMTDIKNVTVGPILKYVSRDPSISNQ